MQDLFKNSVKKCIESKRIEETKINKKLWEEIRTVIEDIDNINTTEETKDIISLPTKILIYDNEVLFCWTCNNTSIQLCMKMWYYGFDSCIDVFQSNKLLLSDSAYWVGYGAVEYLIDLMKKYNV